MNQRGETSIASWFGALLLAASCASCRQDAAPNQPTGANAATTEISFGRRQVDQMLADRPDMVGVLSDDDPVMAWVVDGFNGGRIGQRIHWNGNSPASGAPAEHASAYGHYPPHICLDGGSDVTPIDKWAGLVYELFNIEGTKEFDKLFEQATAGELTSDEYADACAKLEYEALKKAEAYFAEHPLPGAVPGHNPQYDQLRSVPETYEQYLAKFHDPNGKLHHPGEFYRKYFDDMVAPYLEMMRTSAKKGASAPTGVGSQKED